MNHIFIIIFFVIIFALSFKLYYNLKRTTIADIPENPSKLQSTIAAIPENSSKSQTIIADQVENPFKSQSTIADQVENSSEYNNNAVYDSYNEPNNYIIQLSILTHNLSWELLSATQNAAH